MPRGCPVHYPVWRVPVVLLVLLAGCTFSRGDGDPVAQDSVRAQLEARLAEVSGVQQQALELWTRIIDGDLVPCQEAIPVPQPVALSESALAAHPQAEPVQAALNAAIRSVRDSAARWDAECAQERPQVPLNAAQEGRAAALAAGESLSAAAALLAAW